tara:strand:- start:478 stop:1242 length:765 start_codon:yes stop_codon:yes gene_type:complete
MNDYILVQARTGSQRLKNKILLKIHGKTVLEILISRLKRCKNVRNLIIVTTKKSKDDIIIKICKKNQIDYFRGSESNLINRYYECARNFKIDNIVRITSDCVLIDPKIIDKLYSVFKHKKFDYVSNTTPPNKSTFPDGTDVEIFSFKVLKKLNRVCKSKNDKEHLTDYIWRENKFNTFTLKNKQDLSKFKYSLDYKSDYNSLKKIFNILKKKKKFGYMMEVINIIKKNKKMLLLMQDSRKMYLKNKKINETNAL